MILPPMTVPKGGGFGSAGGGTFEADFRNGELRMGNEEAGGLNDRLLKKRRYLLISQILIKEKAISFNKPDSY
jgi:hypothetical protein